VISVIIPALNEERFIAKAVISAKKAPGIEVIVADGGSSDHTVEIAKKYADRVVLSERGRGIQMNAGAAHAKGKYMLFLHGDTTLPDRWNELVIEALEGGADMVGAFSFAVSEKSAALNIIAFMANLRAKILSLPYGDQAFFMSSRLFKKINGFAEIPLMEDIEMVRRVRKFGKIAILKAPVITSSRRWEKEGCLYAVARNQLLLFFYLMGVPAERLDRFYRAVR